MSTCLFCRLIQKELPADILYEDDDCLVFKDKYPKAAIHYLMTSKLHFSNLDEVEPDVHTTLLGRMLVLIPKIARELGLEGYRTIINTGAGGGQEIFHFHIHILSNKGKKLPGF